MARTGQHRGWGSAIHSRYVLAALMLGLLFVTAVFGMPSAAAQTYTVLYNFTGPPDGAIPYAGLIPDTAGDLYGTTQNGGISDCDTADCGTVFKLDKAGKETVLYRFSGGADGGLPQAGLLRDTAGNLYGTTSVGGTNGCLGFGCGVVFKVDKTGKETVLYRFTGGADGSNPQAGLIADKAGNLYGTTAGGGSSGFGTVFRLDKTGTETVLYSFAGPPTDGGAPWQV